MNPKSDGSGGGPTDAIEAGRRLPYLAALDGLRTLALLAVLLDHGGVTAARGGHFGVTVFFVLSGFLVTALLVIERHETGTIDLRAFWARRARRLVPASLAFFAFTLAYVAFAGDRSPSTIVGDGIAALAWVANWRFVLSDRSYGDLFADPTPFAHVWSLAVEEQFYVLFPVVALVLLGRRSASRTGRLAGALLTTIAGATLVLWSQYNGNDPWGLYYGTHTRIAELAVGALLALVLVRRGRLVQLGARVTGALAGAGALSLVAIAAIVGTVDAADERTYRGGLLVVALLAAVVVAACTQPSSGLAKVLGCEPLPQLGRLTYGGYLFHWPIFLWLDEATTGLEGGGLLLVRLLATFTVALLSYELLERPIRAGNLPGRVGPLAWANASVALAAVLIVVVSTVTSPDSSLLASGAGGAAATPPPPPLPPSPAAAAPTSAERTSAAANPTTQGAVAGHGGGAPSLHKATAAPTPAGPPARPGAPARGEAAAPSTTTTTVAKNPDALRVAVVGDSLAQNLGSGLTRWSAGQADMIVYDLSVSSCPISRGGTRRFPDGTDFPIADHCRWWADPDDERTRRLLDFEPDIVLVEDALNEIVDRKLPEWNDYRGPGDPRFDAWLLSEYQAAAEVFSENGAMVVYADAPCADWDRIRAWDSLEDAEERVAALNRIYDGVVAATTRVADLHDRLCPDGRYRDEVEGVAEGRPDGFHLSDDAAFRLAERWLAPFLREVDAADGRPF